MLMKRPDKLKQAKVGFKGFASVQFIPGVYN
jgi:hypothetical protein